MKRLMWGAVVVLSGCGASLQQLKTRAALDLDCGAEQLATRPVDQGTEQVEGCGKSALYVQLFNNARYPTWMLNSPVRETAAKTAER